MLCSNPPWGICPERGSMLLELHVKNLALIEKADAEFREGLNILTGETGAGKSIIIGSVGMALGGKAPKGCIRQGAPYAYVELVFSVDKEEKRKELAELDAIPDENGLLIISRKIMPARSVSKVNDETVTTARLRQITGLLLDIHGQHEHQSLLYKSKHLEILDAYAKGKTQPLKEKTAESYRQYRSLKEKMENFGIDEESRIRERDFLRFEINEIEESELKEGEEEELTARYRRFSNSRRIAGSLSVIQETLQGDWLSRAIQEANQAFGYDESLGNIRDQLYDAESILNDTEHELSAYMDGMEFDGETFRQVEERLDVIHGLQAKYGATVEAILKKLEEKRAKLEELENYEEHKAQTQRELKETENRLEKFCTQLSVVRKEASKKLTEKICQGLLDLNFLDVTFSMEFKRLEHYTAQGFDESQFLISTNPGEPLKPLGDVASGGELSRIMLAVKTVLADTDEIPTLIFDEIDTGISGRTAQKVSEKLSYIAKSHQVICITHLPQIAAMADSHFEIAKSARDGRTATTIRVLERGESVEELARLLGGARITDAVLKNAYEMKDLADRTK